MTLIFVYEEQTAWVSWGRARSEQFGIVNGTRQGSVLSPSFFGVYMDELLVQLRRSGVVCNIGGMFFGAAGYADDIILLAPCRSINKLYLILINSTQLNYKWLRPRTPERAL